MQDFVGFGLWVLCSLDFGPTWSRLVRLGGDRILMPRRFHSRRPNPKTPNAAKTATIKHTNILGRPKAKTEKFESLAKLSWGYASGLMGNPKA